MARTIVHVGRKIRVAIEEETLADGRQIRRDIVLHPGAVAVLPLPSADQVCLLRNSRPAVGEVLWEIPAGTLDAGEAPELAAGRELAEETGFTAASWQKLGSFYPSPGLLSERTHLFVAQQLTSGPMRLEPCENLEPHVVSLADALAWTLDGTIRDAKTMLALWWWQRLRDRS